MTSQVHQFDNEVEANASEADPAKLAVEPRFRQSIDRSPAGRPLEFEPTTNRLNHNVFRYPAKFHPPIAHRLVEMFSKPGDTVLDPFCGSGTLLVEASVLGRNAVGTDVDPLAVFVAHAKTHLHDVKIIERTVAKFNTWLTAHRTSDLDRHGGFDLNISVEVFEAEAPDLNGFIPLLPRINHWFRRRAILQLAKIRREIDNNYHGQASLFLNLCFGAIIRNSSNADPVPVSGLEVTSHMLAKEAAGRIVDPWRLMQKAMIKTAEGVEAYAKAREPSSRIKVHEADARTLDEGIRGVSAVITSPPYLTAVDYYRRHTLEMYWLGLTNVRDERLEIMTRYIGRDKIAMSQAPAKDDVALEAVIARWLPRFSGLKPDRERAFRHYCDGMARVLKRMAHLVNPGGPIVIVAGDVRFCGQPVSMLELMSDLAGEGLVMADHLWYPIINRYMSYARNNEANIAADHVLVFKSKV